MRVFCSGTRPHRELLTLLLLQPEQLKKLTFPSLLRCALGGRGYSVWEWGKAQLGQYPHDS